MAERPRHPNWRLAERILAQVRPGSTGFEPDEISGLGPDSWQPFDLESPPPAVVGQAILDYCRGVVRGVLVVVTFASYLTSCGPFFVDADDLPTLIADHPDLFDDVFASTDVVIVSPATGVTVVVHHSGLIATVPGVIAEV